MSHAEKIGRKTIAKVREKTAMANDTYSPKTVYLPNLSVRILAIKNSI